MDILKGTNLLLFRRALRNNRMNDVQCNRTQPPNLTLLLWPGFSYTSSTPFTSVNQIPTFLGPLGFTGPSLAPIWKPFVESPFDTTALRYFTGVPLFCHSSKRHLTAAIPSRVAPPRPRFLQIRLRHESRDKYVIHISKTAFKKMLFCNAALLCEHYGAAE